MATAAKKSAAAKSAPVVTDRADLEKAIGQALDAADDGARVEVVSDGQTFVAWRDADGAVQVENCGD